MDVAHGLLCLEPAPSTLHFISTQSMKIWDVLLNAPTKMEGVYEAQRLYDNDLLDSVLFMSSLYTDREDYKISKFNQRNILDLYLSEVDHADEDDRPVVMEEMFEYLDTLTGEEFDEIMYVSDDVSEIPIANYFVGRSRSIQTFLMMYMSGPIAPERWTKRIVSIIEVIIILVVCDETMSLEQMLEFIRLHSHESIKFVLLDSVENVLGYRDMSNDSSSVVSLTLFIAYSISVKRVKMLTRRYIGCGINQIIECVLEFIKGAPDDVRFSSGVAIIGAIVSSYDVRPYKTSEVTRMMFGNDVRLCRNIDDV